MHLQLSLLSLQQLPSPEETPRSIKKQRRLQEDRDMASRVAALLLLGVICFEFATAQIAVDCCLSVTEKRLPSKKLVSYTIQEAGKGCDISATVFINTRNMKLCVVHPEGNPWVQRLITEVDKKKQGKQ